MSFNGIIVIGLVEEGVWLEDIRISVAHRVAVNIPANLAQQSRDLAEALNNKQVFQIKGVLPQGTVFRGLGAVPRATAPIPSPHNLGAASSGEAERLRVELERERQKSQGLQSANEALQTTLTAMLGQLSEIKTAVGSLQKGGTAVISLTGPGTKPSSVVEDDVPLFIPDVRRDDAVVSIKVEGEAGSDLASSKSALKALKKQRQGSGK